MNPVREALDYYRRLNEASKDARSRRSLEPPPSPGPGAALVDEPDDSANNNVDGASVDGGPESRAPSRKISLQSVNDDDGRHQPVISVSELESNGHHAHDPEAPPPTPISRER